MSEQFVRLPKGIQKELGPVPTAQGLESFTNSVLTGLLKVSYAAGFMVVYDEAFEILRKRGAFIADEWM